MNMDLRSFLQRLENQEELVKVRRKVSAQFEAAGVISRISSDLGKATLLERIEHHIVPVAGQVLGSFRRLASYFGLEERNIVCELAKRWRYTQVRMTSARGIPRKITTTVDLTKDLPILTHSEKDAGPYITGGIVLAKDPHSNTYNLSYHRMQLIGPNELRVAIGAGHHLGIYFDRAESEGKNLEVAILIGASPAIMVAAAASIGVDEDEMELAGGLVNEPVAVARAEAVNLLIPCDTEIIIEGELIANEKRLEGPFGDWLENYSVVLERHVFRPKVISCRENPIYYTMLAGSPEDLILLGCSAALSILKQVQKVVPSVIDVACWPYPLHCIVQIDQQFEGQGKQAALAALGSNMHWIKYCTVVDKDVDIYSPRDVAWAMASRCCPDKDIYVIPNTPSFYGDPRRMHWGRLVMDATAPFDRKEEYERKRIPGETEIDLKDYLER